MHRYWKHVTAPLLHAIDARTLVEIGAGRGEHADVLLRYCAQHDGSLTIIDPSPSFDIASWKRKWGARMTMLLQPSVEALPTLTVADVIFIDGDHNWHTVAAELDFLASCRGRDDLPTLIVLHDTDWPYARRDMYYAPECIPQQRRHLYRRSGVVPGQSALDDGGVHHAYLHAEHEGGACNGVLTAVEDFLSKHPNDYRWQALPGLYGYGILAHRKLLQHYPALQALLDTFQLTPFAAAHLAAVDVGHWQERATLSQHAFRQQEHATAIQKDADALRNRTHVLEQGMRELGTHADDLQSYAQRLHVHAEQVTQHAANLQAAYDSMLRSRSWRWTAFLRRWFR